MRGQNEKMGNFGGDEFKTEWREEKKRRLEKVNTISISITSIINNIKFRNRIF